MSGKYGRMNGQRRRESFSEVLVGNVKVLESDVKTVKMMTMVLLAFVVTFGVCLSVSLLGFIFNK